MAIKISNITIDTQSISPTLTVEVEVEYDYSINIPISISGRLLSADNKVLSQLNESQINSEYDYDLRILNKTERDKIKEGSKRNYYAQLTAVLTPKAIEHIEIQREKNTEKSVKFSVGFVVKYLVITAEQQNLIVENLLKLQIKKSYSEFTIKQSDWIRNYSSHLGIGNFLLLELQVPDDKKVSIFWKKLYEKLCQNVKDMEISIRSGDWEKTMFIARKFFENVKIGDNKSEHKKFKEEFGKLMEHENHGKEGIENLYDAIWKFFEFVSKYVHDKDKTGNINPSPISKKEDAYFAYVLAIGLLNLIGGKINEK